MMMIGGVPQLTTATTKEFAHDSIHCQEHSTVCEKTRSLCASEIQIEMRLFSICCIFTMLFPQCIAMALLLPKIPCVQ